MRTRKTILFALTILSGVAFSGCLTKKSGCPSGTCGGDQGTGYGSTSSGTGGYASGATSGGTSASPVPLVDEGSATADACVDEGERDAPVEVSPDELGEACLSISFSKIAHYLGKRAGDLAKVEGRFFFNHKCTGVETPDYLSYVTGAALKKDETGGADFAGEIRLPLPSQVDAKIKKIDVPVGTALLVGKVVKFHGKRLIKLVNIATIQQEGDAKFIETISQSAREAMSGAMKIAGPGIYALYKTSKPVGFLSGQVITEAGAAVPGAIVVGTSAPFLSVADEAGHYTMTMLQGQVGVAAYDLKTGSYGSVSLPMEKKGTLNPKTGKPAEIPGEEKTIQGADALSLARVDITVKPDLDVASSENLGFETGDYTNWATKGDALVLADLFTKFFPKSNERFYSFLSTGKGSMGEIKSSMSRKVSIPKGAKAMRIEYHFISQEYPSWVNTKYNDIFMILFAGSPRFLHSETVNSNAGKWQDLYEKLGNVEESIATYQGVYQQFGGTTGLRTARYDVRACAGKKATLIFNVSDIGDAIYDSAALINRIWFE